MKTKQIWANLGVENIHRTKSFYASLGFQLNERPSDDLVSFFFGPDNFVIHFFRKEKLESSLEGKTADLSQGNEVMFSLAADTKAAYDDWVIEIQQAGGTIVFDSNTDRKAYYDDNGFYVCVFTDPDGHKFNLLYNKNI
ncbi:MAG: glyoxalase/bleomycin resistance/extradiol dioxygenase family protein [Pseudozobellia sp.]|nr:glyoxalase/bleomycin resistance/extradiol dioxygenase family protein [Pseudozobellia sp.]MBG48917.1 glyoxalase/bleomycin resistance/extradiol dioxygenase family protein [Pseudozobellia sp.]|tara:strand:+ start:414 stop:830 length:417 start_codon:yes stop_codon:yes gene_type:complete